MIARNHRTVKKTIPIKKNKPPKSKIKVQKRQQMIDNKRRIRREKESLVMAKRK